MEKCIVSVTQLSLIQQPLVSSSLYLSSLLTFACLLNFFCSISFFLSMSINAHTATMRRFSSEGSLLDLDFLPWKRVMLNNPDCERNRDSGTYKVQVDEVDGRSPSLNPIIQEPRASTGEPGQRELTKEHSVSVENIRDLEKQDKTHLGVCVITEGCRAYSDSQLAPAAQGSTENMERCYLPPQSPLSPSNPFPLKSQNRHQSKPKLSAAKLHLKSLFGQVRHQLSFTLQHSSMW